MGKKKDLLQSLYDESSGKSIVRKATKYGIFKGETKVCKEDKDIQNKWDGLLFAEHKADIQYWKAKKNVLRERAIGVRTALFNLSQNPGKEEKPFLKKLEKQYLTALKEYERANEIYNYMKGSYKKVSENILETRRSMRAKQNKTK